MSKKTKKRADRQSPSLFHEMRQNQNAYRVYLVLLVLTGTVALRSAFIGRWENVFISFLAVLLYFIPPLVEKTAHIELPTALEIIAFVFVFAAEVLGEIANFYERVPIWDTLLHTVCGFMFAAFGFSLVDILSRGKSKSQEVSPVFLAFVAFCFSMTVGVAWEFIEFSIDSLMLKDMQKDSLITSIYSIRFDSERKNRVTALENIVKTVITMKDGNTVTIDGYLDIGLIDTMKDLFVNFIGATVFSIIGFFYVKYRGRGKFARQFIPKYKTPPPKNGKAS